MRPLLTVLAAIVLAGCGGSDAEEPAAPVLGVRDLTSLEPLKAAFNGDAGTPRLLLILEPT